jgi:cell wall-associated NlpC family hydrolase
MSPGALQAFKQHVLDAYPYEACGVLAGGCYVPCRNVAANPLRHFELSAEDQARATLDHGRIEAVLHSHPYGLASSQGHPREWPSHADMAGWVGGTTTWGIVSTDGSGVSEPVWLQDHNPAPYSGREFVWGAADCYQLIRDWYWRERGQRLLNFARSWAFWKDGTQIYLDNFRKAGFEIVTSSDVQPGDVALMRYGTRVVAHGGIVTGPDELLHHQVHRLSGYDSLHKWMKQIDCFVRYQG